VLSLATITAQTVASRFSLRLLRVHLRGMADKVVIAIFAMTTTYIIIEHLRMVSLSADDLAPPVTVFVSGILLFSSSLAIIWHINHTLQSIRVDRPIRSVTAATRRTAAAVARQQDEYGSAATADFAIPETAQPLVSVESGHVVEVDIGDLAEIADRYALVVCVSAVVGTALVSGETLGWVEGSGATPIPIETRRAIVDAVSVEPARDPLTDVGLGIDDAVTPILAYTGNDETVIAALARLVRLVEHVTTEDVERDRARRLGTSVARAAQDTVGAEPG
jgi:uncharacterized membrane protein